MCYIHLLSTWQIVLCEYVKIQSFIQVSCKTFSHNVFHICQVAFSFDNLAIFLPMFKKDDIFLAIVIGLFFFHLFSQKLMKNVHVEEECILFHKITKHFFINSFIWDLIILQRLSLIERIKLKVNSRKFVFGIFLDLEKDFDTTYYKTLTLSLIIMGLEVRSRLEVLSLKGQLSVWENFWQLGTL